MSSQESLTAERPEIASRWDYLQRAIVDATERLEGVAHRTPVLTSRMLNSKLDCDIFMKAETYQRTGSFKFRGAYNRLAIAAAEDAEGIVAHSSGNFAQAVALAGQLLGLRVVVVMPSDAPRIKADAVRTYGAEIVHCGRDSDERITIASRLASDRGWILVEPYDDMQVIAGQATAAVELFSEVGSLDALVVPLGGGGLLSGSALAAKAFCPSARLAGVEPSAMPKTALSLSSNQLVTVPTRVTAMDGQMISHPGKVTYPIISDLVNDIITIDDKAAVSAMRWLYEQLKVVVEPSGASGLAALMAGKLESKGKIGVILSGGNVGIEQMAELCRINCA